MFFSIFLSLGSITSLVCLFVWLSPHNLNLIIVILGGKMGFFLSNFVSVKRLCPT